MSIHARFQIRKDTFQLDVDLDLPGSGVTSFFGPSGCGKTSLLRAMAGLDRHEGSRITVNGMRWQDKGVFLPTHRRSLGYVFQEPSLFDHLDVEGNIMYGKKRAGGTVRKAAIEDAVELLDLGPLLPRMPSTLSGGERQRVAIARALAVEPQLLLMDEPLAAVDVSRKQEILPYIQSLHRQLEIPIIHVSHLREEIAQIADHVVVLGGGGVSAAAPIEEIFTRLDLPLAHMPMASSIINARVLEVDRAYDLARLDFGGGELLVVGARAKPGQSVRVEIAARDVSITLARQTGTSILNILECAVEAISHEDKNRVSIRLGAGSTPLLASITRKSADELELEPGRNVFAQVKSVALLP